MPIVNPAVRIWSGLTSSTELGENFRSIKHNPAEIWEVTCTPDAEHYHVLQAENIPPAGSLLPGFTNVYSKRYVPQCISPVLWQIRIEYEGSIDLSSYSGSPLDIPAIVDWSDVEVEEEIDEDWDGNPITTAAGEPVTGIKAIFCDPVATIKKNIATYDPYAAAVYRRSTNSDTFLGWPPGTAKIMRFEVKPVKDYVYWEATVVVQFRIPYRTTAEKAWYQRWRHEGFYHKRDDAGYEEIVRAQDDEGRPSEVKVLLDEDGFKLPTGDPPVWKETKRYGSLPFGALGLIP